MTEFYAAGKRYCRKGNHWIDTDVGMIKSRGSVMLCKVHRCPVSSKPRARRHKERLKRLKYIKAKAAR